MSQLREIILFVWAVLLGASCASDAPLALKEPVTKKSHDLSRFTIAPGELTKHADPLPNMIEFNLVSAVSSEEQSEEEPPKLNHQFRGWDFDKDGLIDMLESLDRNGAVQAYYFDFDGDGKIDLSRMRNDGKVETH